MAVKRPKPCRVCSRPLNIVLPKQVCICDECFERAQALAQADELESQGLRDDAQAIRSWAAVLADKARAKGGWFPGEPPKDTRKVKADDAHVPRKEDKSRDWQDLYDRRQRNKLMRNKGEMPRIGRPPLPPGMSTAGVVVGYRVPQDVRAKLIALGGKDWLVRAVLAAQLPEEAPARVALS